MKSKFNRLSRLNQFALAVVTTSALATTVHATTNTWLSATGNWSNSAKWDVNGVPLNDSTADLIFSDAAATYTATVNPAALAIPDTNWSINSLTFSENSLGSGNNSIAGAAGATLTLGAGGITQNDNSSPTLTLPVIASASQTWSINNWRTNNTGGLNINGNLTLNDTVTILKTGTVVGKGDVVFNSGTTTTVGSGAFTLQSNNISFSAESQFNRLGTNALTVDSSLNRRMGLVFQDSASGTCGTPINITGGLSGNNCGLTISFGNGVVAAGTTFTMTGAWSGAIVGGGTNATGYVNHMLFGTINCYDDRYRIVYQGNNSGLTSTADPGAGTGVFHIRSGVVVFDSANALGTGNSLGILVGNNSSSQTNQYAGLLATSGNDVAAKILVRWVQNGSNQRQTVSELGLSGAGSVNYTGTIYLNNISTVNAKQATSLKLTAPAGGTATFSGLMRDYNTPLSNGPLCPPVFVLGEGAVKLSGSNTYNGTTSVRGGTLLLGSNSAMGAATSAVSLGDTVTAPSGGDVVAATTAELTGTYTWTAGVFTWTADAPTALDGVTLNDGDRILVKDASSGPARTGVYTRTSLNVWTRSSDLSTAADYTAGLRVHVAGPGILNANKNFYLQYGLLGTAVLNSTAADNTAAQFFFNPDAASNADVAILTDAPVTISRPINVTNNLSTGKSILGGNSAVTSVFSGVVTLNKDLTVTAATGGSVEFTGDITGSNAVTKEGPGTVVFSTPKSYTGATTVSAGVLDVNDSLASTSVIVAGGGTLQGNGTVLGTINVDGTIAPGSGGVGTLITGTTTIDGTLAVEVDGGNGNDQLLSGSAINIGSNATLSVSLLGGGFTPGGTYVIAEGSSLTGTFASVPYGYMVTYTTTQAILSEAVGTDFDVWAAGYTFANPPVDIPPTADPDGDGLVNQQEYAFGLNPTLGSSANPITVPLDKSTGTFTYTRRKNPATTGLTYTVQTSTDLVTWTTASVSGEAVTDVGNNQSVVVTLSGAPLSAPQLFVRVSAE